MRYDLFTGQKDGLILISRILLVVLFVIFGWQKLSGFSGTVGYMASDGLPVPELAAAIAVIMEFFVDIALVVGFYTRPLALLLALYTLATAFIAHHYWTMSGGARMGNEINFYKNLSIIGGLILLCATGPGRYSIDRK